MGWNDREPYFSAIQSLVDNERLDYATAVRRVADSMIAPKVEAIRAEREAADDE